MTDFRQIALDAIEQKRWTRHTVAKAMLIEHRIALSQTFAILNGSRPGNRMHWQMIFDLLDMQFTVKSTRVPQTP